MKRTIVRVTALVCGTALFIVYALTGQNGVLTGAAGTMIGVGIDVLREKTQETTAKE